MFCGIMYKSTAQEQLIYYNSLLKNCPLGGIGSCLTLIRNYVVQSQHQ